MAGKKVQRTNSAAILIRNAHLSPNEIAEATGFDPIEAMQRLQELLDSRDWLSQRRQEQLLIIEMQDLIQDARDRLANADDEHYAAMANVVLRGMKEVGLRMDARRKLIDMDINQITAAHGQLFGSAFDVALKHIVGTLVEENPVIEPARVRELQREGMLLARAKLEESMEDD